MTEFPKEYCIGGLSANEHFKKAVIERDNPQQYLHNSEMIDLLDVYGPLAGPIFMRKPYSRTA